jgi:hypothetical protein
MWTYIKPYKVKTISSLVWAKDQTLYNGVRIVNFNFSVNWWFQKSFTINYQNKSLTEARWFETQSCWSSGFPTKHYNPLSSGLLWIFIFLTKPLTRCSIQFNFYANTFASSYQHTTDRTHYCHLPISILFMCKTNSTHFTHVKKCYIRFIIGY